MPDPEIKSALLPAALEPGPWLNYAVEYDGRRFAVTLSLYGNAVVVNQERRSRDRTVWVRVWWHPGDPQQAWPVIALAQQAHIAAGHEVLAPVGGGAP
jgi:hypothetical protein